MPFPRILPRAYLVALVLGALLLGVACDDPRAALPAPEVVTRAEASDLPPEAGPRVVLPPASEAPAVVGAVEVVPGLGGLVFESAVEMGEYPGGRVFVAEQSGLVRTFEVDGSGERELLDLRLRVTHHNELGLLSVALDPAFESNGWLWVYYVPSEGALRTVLSRFTVRAGRADPASELVVLEVPQPFENHNGGAIRFGPGGLLYLGLGDGGGFGDPDYHGQDPHTLLGSVIRIDVRESSAAHPYRVPLDNPFVDGDRGRPEVFAYGLRNPWRMAFDPATGALWVGDVGEREVEEVNIVTTGGNYGWSRVEGYQCFRAESGCGPQDTLGAVVTYHHTEGRCSITGGVVYRGDAVRALRGTYLFGDLCTGEVWAVPADAGGAPVLVAQDLGPLVGIATAYGEVYTLSFGQPVHRLVDAP